MIENEEAFKISNMKQLKNQRDTQFATTIALTRDRVYWMTGAIGTTAIIKILKPRVSPLIAPVIFISTIMAYQIDMVSPINLGLGK